MANVVCFECKSEVPAGSEQCPDCGFIFGRAEAVKCPACANMVVFSSGSCPECGFPSATPDEPVQRSLATEKVHPEAPADTEPLEPEELAELAASFPPVIVSAGADGAMMSMPVENDATSEMLKAQTATLIQLMNDMSRYLDDSRNSNGSQMTDLNAGIEKCLQGAEKMTLDMMNAATEQSLGTLNSIQEVAAAFTGEMKSVVDGITNAKNSAVTEVTNAALQAKSDLQLTSSQLESKLSSTVDLILYVCLGMLLFASLNIAVTAYVIKLVK